MPRRQERQRSWLTASRNRIDAADVKHSRFKVVAFRIHAPSAPHREGRAMDITVAGVAEELRFYVLLKIRARRLVGDSALADWRRSKRAARPARAAGS